MLRTGLTLNSHHQSALPSAATGSKLQAVTGVPRCAAPLLSPVPLCVCPPGAMKPQVLAVTDAALRALPKELLPLSPTLLISYDLPTRKVRGGGSAGGWIVRGCSGCGHGGAGLARRCYGAETPAPAAAARWLLLLLLPVSDAHTCTPPSTPSRRPTCAACSRCRPAALPILPVTPTPCLPPCVFPLNRRPTCVARSRCWAAARRRAGTRALLCTLRWRGCWRSCARWACRAGCPAARPAAVLSAGSCAWPHFAAAGVGWRSCARGVDSLRRPRCDHDHTCAAVARSCLPCPPPRPAAQRRLLLPCRLATHARDRWRSFRRSRSRRCRSTSATSLPARQEAAHVGCCSHARQVRSQPCWRAPEHHRRPGRPPGGRPD